MSYRGLGDPTLFSGLTPSLIFRLPPTTCNSPCLPRAPYTLVVPTAAFPAFYGTPTPSNPSPTADTAHCPECCVVASSGVLLPLLPLALSARPPRSILYNYPAYITKVAAKLSSPVRNRPFQPPAGQLRAGSINSLSLFARATSANAIHRSCFSSLSKRHRYASFSRV